VQGRARRIRLSTWRRTDRCHCTSYLRSYDARVTRVGRDRTAVATVGLYVVGTLLAACSPAGDPAGASRLVPPPTTSASAETLAVAQARLLPVVAKAPAGSIGARWTLLGVADGGRRILLETVASGGCAVFAGVVVTESAALVTISPRTSVSRPTGALCPDHQTLTVGSVELSAPLGTRPLSEGSPSYPH
jgi:hypothetical protein